MFNVEADVNESIADVKNKIKESQGFAMEAQKIIYAGRSMSRSFNQAFIVHEFTALIFDGELVGKVLGDATTVGQHNIKEKDFLVVMVTKASTPLLLSISTSTG